jgi:hypothetical protein
LIINIVAFAGIILNIRDIEKYYKIMLVKINIKILFYRSQLLPKKKALLIPLDSSTIGMLSLNTFNIDLIFDPSKSSYNDKLGTVMAIKPVTEELILIAYESGQLLLWDMKKNNVLSSLVIEEYPMTLDFDVSLMQGIIGSASNKLEVKN